ncbi:hypothetical protein [Paracoccus nototheniae]|uniref:hypothetical protein n=1 Tax=Paracoccus nototheniae TaxID=2489002 RepID=UPI00103C11BA|nr:hypothetical protein [Paracoccus nototheniae]
MIGQIPARDGIDGTRFGSGGRGTGQTGPGALMAAAGAVAPAPAQMRGPGGGAARRGTAGTAIGSGIGCRHPLQMWPPCRAVKPVCPRNRPATGT